jgi:hypothetical protein
VDELALGSPVRVLRYRRRAIGPAELDFIRAMIAMHAARGRSWIARVLCEAWDWRQPTGALKVYACRTLKQQHCNVVDYIARACEAALRGEPAPALLPTQVRPRKLRRAA